MKRTRVILAAVASVAALALAACGGGANDPLASGGSSSPAASDTIVVGSANFPESELLGQIYAGALTAKGVKVTTKLNIGSRETYIPGLQDGSIDLIPEYSGVLLQYFDKNATAVSSDDVYAALKTKVPAKLPCWTSPPAEDKDRSSVTKETADKYNLKSIADLAAGRRPAHPRRPAGVEDPADGVARPQGEVQRGVQGVQDAGRRRPADQNALKNGSIQAGDVFTTDPNISPTAGSRWRTRRTSSPRRTCCR